MRGQSPADNGLSETGIGDCRKAPPIERMHLAAAMASPIARPAHRPARPNDGTGKIAKGGRVAPGGDARAARRPSGKARHRSRPYHHVPGRELAPRAAEEFDKAVARLDRSQRRTGMGRTAAAVHLARGDARDPHLGSFGAPHGPITVPYGGRRTGKGGSRCHGLGDEEHHRRGSPLIARLMRSISPRAFASFTADAVAVAVKVPAIAGIALAQRRGARGTRLGAIGELAPRPRRDGAERTR